jgi:hypothetical protein
MSLLEATYEFHLECRNFKSIKLNRWYGRGLFGIFCLHRQLHIEIQAKAEHIKQAVFSL